MQSRIDLERMTRVVRWAGTVALVVTLALPVTALAQSDFDRARELAFAGSRDEARTLLMELLEERPEHWDARILLGRLYAWDGRYQEGREHLLVVVRAKPDYADARVALADLELWSDNPERALEVLEEGLRREPTRQEFLLRAARAQKDVGELERAAVTLDRLLDVNPSHGDGQRLFRSLRRDRMRSKMGLSYGYTGLDDLDRPWHEASFQLGTRTGIGTVIARVNWANRFERNTAQYELDAYPKLFDGLYLYLNYGYSPFALYPRHRMGAEAYVNIDGGIELSAGLRHLKFESRDVTIYTGTLAKYQGSWWIAFRPYITPKDLGTSRSYQVTVRRYFGNADSYLGVIGGIGSSPGEFTDSTDLLRNDSWKVGLRGQVPLGDVVLLKYSGGYGWEEFTSGRERRSFSFNFGFERRF